MGATMSATTKRSPQAHRQTATALALIAWLGAVSFTQISAASTVNPESARIAEIDQLLAQTFQPTHPGALVIVSRDGKLLLKKAYGLADTEKNTPLQFTDTMRIGSVTKPFTAMAIMLLEEDGKLSVQDDITRHLPEFSTEGRKVTIAHLLSHTSGLSVYTESPKLREMIRPETTPADVLNFIKTLPAQSAPGELWDYNNSGYYLLGAIIEKVSGMTYAEFLAKRIFAPLQMAGTAVEGAPGAKPVISSYRAQGGRFSAAPPLSPVVAWSAGAVVSTAEDMQRWVAAVESRKLLKPATWQRVMTTTPLISGRATEYGYGWTIRKLRGQALIEHSGNVVGFQAQVMMLPEEKLSFIVMTNQQHRNNMVRHLTERIAAIAIGRPFAQHKAIELSDAALDALAGTYEAKGTNARTLTRVGKQLRLAAGSAQALLHAYGEDTFFQPETSHTHYRFVRDASGNVKQLIRVDAGDEEQVFERVVKEAGAQVERSNISK
jgi:CubicO group peptidase (beta-lactamase class C family)